jgi:hypothetical protein
VWQRWLDWDPVQMAPRFELFNAGHGRIDYCYPLALAWLCHRITDPPT